MNTQDFMKEENLEKYSFLWSEARLVLAAVALAAGGIPFLRLIVPWFMFFGLVSLILTLAWIISGAASAYLAYRWYNSGQKVFGGKGTMDLVAFFVSVISGLNLGVVGLTGRNIGMSLIYSRIIFGITVLVYLATAMYLYKRWNENHKKLF